MVSSKPENLQVRVRKTNCTHTSTSLARFQLAANQIFSLTYSRNYTPHPLQTANRWQATRDASFIFTECSSKTRNFNLFVSESENTNGGLSIQVHVPLRPPLFYALLAFLKVSVNKKGVNKNYIPNRNNGLA